jgi:hypothetical protein
VSIDYVELVKQSVKRAWEHKFLWLFGFFVVGKEYPGVTHSIGNIPSPITYSRRFDFDDFEDFSDLHNFMPFGIGIETILLLIAGAFLVWLFFLLMGFLSEGALVHGVSRKRLGEPVTFGQCWAKGVDSFWRVLVILILVGLVASACVIFMIVMLIPAFILSVKLGLVVAIMFALPVLLVIIFTAESICAWSIRFTVLDGVPCFDSIGKGWQMFRENLGKTFGVALSSVLTQIVIAIAVAVATLLIAVPFILIALGSPIAAIVMGLPILLVVAVLVGAYIGVFKSSVWTLAFMQMTGKISASSPSE